MIIMALVTLACIILGSILLVFAFNICVFCSRETKRETAMKTCTYYVVSGWDCKGNQIVGTYKANTDEEAEAQFLANFEDGEVNEILCTFEDGTVM